MVENMCIFHPNCNDFCHILVSFLVIAFFLFVFVGIICLIYFFVSCAIHTSFCNSLSMDNADKIRDLEGRVIALEKNGKEGKHKIATTI